MFKNLGEFVEFVNIKNKYFFKWLGSECNKYM